jgi:hypothetical protein
MYQRTSGLIALQYPNRLDAKEGATIVWLNSRSLSAYSSGGEDSPRMTRTFLVLVRIRAERYGP